MNENIPPFWDNFDSNGRRAEGREEGGGELSALHDKKVERVVITKDEKVTLFIALKTHIDVGR